MEYKQAPLVLVTNMSLLPFKKAVQLLNRYQIPLVPSGRFTSIEEALEFVQRIGYPVVVKISSPQVMHKTEYGGVKADIETEEEFRRAWKDLFSVQKKFSPPGLIVQKMRRGFELSAGVERDAQFGPVIMFGWGGIFIEILRQVNFRIAPIDKKQAQSMIDELQGAKVLKGFRGHKQVDCKKIVRLLVNLSSLATENPGVEQVDLNPIMTKGSLVEVADVRIYVNDSFRL